MGSIAGLLEVKVNGRIYNAKGNFTYNLGADKNEAIVGPDRVHGFKVSPQVPFIEGEFTDESELDVPTLLRVKDATVTLSLRNGKVIVLKGARFCGDGNVGTEESNIAIRFEGLKAEEVR